MTPQELYDQLYQDTQKQIIEGILNSYPQDQLFAQMAKSPLWETIKDKDWQLQYIWPVQAFIDHGITDLGIINALSNLRPVLDFEEQEIYSEELFLRYCKKHNIAVKRVESQNLQERVKNVT